VSRFIAPFVVLGAVAGCRSDGLDTKLSTELQRVRLVVRDWPPLPGSKEPSATKSPNTACALHLVDETTATIYQIARSHKTKPDGGGNDPTTWPEQGDYSVHHPGDDGPGGDALVRIECGTWKVLGIVSSRATR
jgi:hypothetical protein